MRRVVLLVVSILTVMSMTVSPALAHDRDRDCWDEDWAFWVCDRNDFDDVRIIFVPVGFWTFDPFWGWFWKVHQCPFWGDFSGSVNFLDCFD